MSIKDTLLQRHTDSLLDAERTFGDDADEMKANYQRHLDVALQALSEARPQIKQTELQLVPFRSTYAAPSNIRAVHACYWGRTHKAVSQPWDDGYMGRLPQWTVYVNTADIRFLRATPVPTASQIQVAGSMCEIEYTTAHVLTDTECSLNDEEQGLLLLRAQAEAMREIAMKNSTVSYQLREGIGSTPKNGTPAYLYQELLAEFERRVAR